MSRSAARTVAWRPYGGASASERREQRRATLLDAALDVLATDGVAAVTVRRVCATAQLNDRYFYESFADTDQLLGAVIEHQIGLAFQALSDATATAGDIPARAKTVITAALDYLAEDPRRGRLLIESQATETLRSGRRQLVNVVSGLMIAEAHNENLPTSVTESELQLIALTLINGGLEVVSQWLSGDLIVTREELIDVLVAMILTSSQIELNPVNHESAPGTASTR